MHLVFELFSEYLETIMEILFVAMLSAFMCLQVTFPQKQSVRVTQKTRKNG
jgi:hypothetical protein